MKLNYKKIVAAANKAMKGLASPGFCVKCGKEYNGIEPDARKYPCAKCGSASVYGAEELVLMLS
jgi:PHP family Zn ribbon phosphoesterase